MNNQSGQKITPFIAILIGYQLVLAVLVAVYGYTGSFLLLNGLHRDWLDAPMFLLTHLGDALILTSLFGLIFFRKNPGLVVLLILVVIITGLAGQLMKNFLFDSWDRPLSLIGRGGEVHTVYGYLLYQNSFPSGHSITASAAITAVVLTLRPGKPLMILLALFTAIVSYTRIYVGVHFAGDVLAGTVLGAAGAIFLTAWLSPRIGQWVAGLSTAGFKRLQFILLVMAVSGLTGGIMMLAEYLQRMF
ncbi:MAG: phosphatase PAP2 family protein [Bacteroidales bacterium]|nr:phosphatase PAP2 family protein [Bacteroidales bacterium]